MEFIIQPGTLESKGGVINFTGTTGVTRDTGLPVSGSQIFCLCNEGGARSVVSDPEHTFRITQKGVFKHKSLPGAAQTPKSESPWGEL